MKRMSSLLAITALVVVEALPSITLAVAPGQRERNVIWRDPGDVRRLNLAWAEGGAAAAPKPPFTFVSEDKGGSNPKIEVRDSRGVVWGVKWGSEVNSEV